MAAVELQYPECLGGAEHQSIGLQHIKVEWAGWREGGRRMGLVLEIPASKSANQ